MIFNLLQFLMKPQILNYRCFGDTSNIPGNLILLQMQLLLYNFSFYTSIKDCIQRYLEQESYYCIQKLIWYKHFSETPALKTKFQKLFWLTSGEFNQIHDSYMTCNTSSLWPFLHNIFTSKYVYIGFGRSRGATCQCPAFGIWNFGL